MVLREALELCPIIFVALRVQNYKELRSSEQISRLSDHWEEQRNTPVDGTTVRKTLTLNGRSKTEKTRNATYSTLRWKAVFLSKPKRIYGWSFCDPTILKEREVSSTTRTSPKFSWPMIEKLSESCSTPPARHAMFARHLREMFSSAVFGGLENSLQAS